jgi:transposase-like protein
MSTAKGPWTPQEKERVRELIQKGQSLEKVAATLGRTPHAVRKIAGQMKLSLRKLGRYA